MDEPEEGETTAQEQASEVWTEAQIVANLKAADMHDYYHCRLRWLARVQKLAILNHYVRRATECMTQDVLLKQLEDLDAMVMETAELVLKLDNPYYKLMVILCVGLASPSFYAVLQENSDQFDLASFMNSFRNNVDCYLCGQSERGTLCLDGAKDRRYRDIYALVAVMRSVIFSM